MQNMMSSLARRIGKTLLICAMSITSVACSVPGNETVIDLYGDTLCAGWNCEGNEVNRSDALDHAKLNIEGSMWLYGNSHLLEKGNHYDQMVLLSFEAGGRLHAVSVDQTRDSDTKKVTFRMDRLNATYRILPEHIELQGLEPWFKSVTKAEVILDAHEFSFQGKLARGPTRLSLWLNGGKAAAFKSYVIGYNQETDKQLEILLASAQAGSAQ